MSNYVSVLNTLNPKSFNKGIADNLEKPKSSNNQMNTSSKLKKPEQENYTTLGNGMILDDDWYDASEKKRQINEITSYKPRKQQVTITPSMFQSQNFQRDTMRNKKPVESFSRQRFTMQAQANNGFETRYADTEAILYTIYNNPSHRIPSAYRYAATPRVTFPQVD
jgi:hypothetical protein